MSSDERINGKTHTYLMKASHIAGSWPLKYIVLPALFFGIPSLVLASLSDGVAAQAFVDIGVDIDFLRKHSSMAYLLSIATLGAYAIVPRVAAANLDSRPAITLRKAVTPIECFERIVQFKANRFGSECKDVLIKTPSMDDGAVFSRITKPDQQIIYIVEVIHAFLQTFDQNAEFKVRLIEVGPKDQFIGWYTHAPGSSFPSTQVPDLNSRESLAMNSLRAGELKVVEDISKELKKASRTYVKTSHESGSALCYPVKHAELGSVPFVLAVWTSKAGFFKNKEKSIYNWMLYKFAQRIALEYTLLRLKERRVA